LIASGQEIEAELHIPVRLLLLAIGIMVFIIIKA